MKKLIWSIVAIVVGVIVFFAINLVLFMRSSSQISSGDAIVEYSGDKGVRDHTRRPVLNKL